MCCPSIFLRRFSLMNISITIPKGIVISIFIQSILLEKFPPFLLNLRILVNFVAYNPRFKGGLRLWTYLFNFVSQLSFRQKIMIFWPLHFGNTFSPHYFFYHSNYISLLSSIVPFCIRYSFTASRIVSIFSLYIFIALWDVHLNSLRYYRKNTGSISKLSFGVIRLSIFFWYLVFICLCPISLLLRTIIIFWYCLL